MNNIEAIIVQTLIAVIQIPGSLRGNPFSLFALGFCTALLILSIRQYYIIIRTRRLISKDIEELMKYMDRERKEMEELTKYTNRETKDKQ